jgi:hypothetical protein
MALKIGTDLKNYIINQAIAKQLAGTMGTGGSAVLRIYNGTQPTNADAATAGTMLCEIINIGWGGTGNAGTIGGTGGTVSHSSGAAGYSGTAANTGTATWGRFETFGTGFTGSAATFRIDGDVGTGATCSFVINVAAITSGGTVTLLTAPISMA